MNSFLVLIETLFVVNSMLCGFMQLMKLASAPDYDTTTGYA